MKKLSLKECKKRCAELWDWLANNPERYKNEWPLWTFNGGKYNRVACHCFACAYTLSSKSGKIDCNKCFLLNLWFSGKIPKNIKEMINSNHMYIPCTRVQNSPYKLYQNHEKRSFYARKIADYCKKY